MAAINRQVILAEKPQGKLTPASFHLAETDVPIPGEGEALVVTVHNPTNEFLYWGLTTTTAWMESLDYRYTTTNLNNHTAERDENGDWRLVISPVDPGVPNWLDPAGHDNGTIMWRWNYPQQQPPSPRTRVVPLSQVADLPLTE